jgi:hypothetical protein
MRGGRVRLQSIVTPLTEFDHPEKGDALYGELLSACPIISYVFYSMVYVLVLLLTPYCVLV